MRAGRPPRGGRRPHESRGRLPILARAILRLIPVRDRRALIEEDLAEEHGRTRAERGRLAATVASLGGAAESVADCWLGEASWRSIRTQLGPRGLRRTGLRSGGWLGDVRFGLRMVRREPVVSGAVILTVVIGVAATSAVMSVLLGVLVRPLPFPDSDRIVRVERSDGGRPAQYPVVGLLDLLDWRERGTAFSALAAWNTGGLTLTGDADPERIRVANVTAGLDRVLGVAPAAGRMLAPDEFSPGNDGVIVLSHAFWVRRFGADPGIVGSSLSLDARPYRVVGVLQESPFVYPEDVDGWVPLAPSPDSWMWRYRGSSYLTAVARLAPGLTLETAQERMSALQRALVEEFPRDQEGQDAIRLERLHDVVVAPARPAVRLLSLTVAIVLVLACANVSVLLLSRANGRRPELAVRSALGGNRVRLTRLLLTETMVLAALGGAIGLLLARPLVRAIVALVPGGLPRAAEIGIDGWVLAASFAAIAVTGVAAGLVPAVALGRLDVGIELRERDGGSGSRRERLLRHCLVGAQLALSACLLIGATLLGRTLLNLRATSPGFEPTGRIAFRISPAEARYPTPGELTGFYRGLLEGLATAPGIRDAGAVNFLPFTGGEWGGSFEVGGERRDARIRISWPGYYRALGLRVLRGRAFDWRDDRAAPEVAILNEAAARAAFQGEDPIGRTLVFGDRPREIVGIVADVHHRSLAEAPAPELHLPGTQQLDLAASVIVRAEGDPAAAIPVARDVLRRLDPSVAMTSVATMEERIETSVAPERFRAALIGVLGALAAILALIGVYGVMSYTVTCRRREIGIRVALGASSASLVRRVLGSAATVSAVGISAGVALAWGAARWGESLLYGVAPRDPVAFLIVPALLLVAGLLAALGPAVRATRVDPLTTIRQE